MIRLDDALIHQGFGSLAQVVDDDPRWFDRYYFNCHAIDGSFAVSHGLGVYPNTNVMDGWAIVATPEKQINIRASRELVNGDRDNLVIGPIKAEILEPMKSWRFTLAENDYGISYDFTYHARFDPLEPLRMVSEIDGRKVWDWLHFTHVGRVQGWAEIEGCKVDFDQDSHWSIRDRSWGVRPGVGQVVANEQQLSAAKWGTRHNWVCLQMEECFIWYFLTEEDDGTQRFFEGMVRWSAELGGKQEKIRSLHRNIDWAENDRFLAVELVVELESGKKMCVNASRLPTTVHIRGAGYGGHDGVTHGMPQGPLVISGDRWEPCDSKDNPETFGLQDHMVDVVWDGKTGYGLFELSWGS